jgi:hypothetical protein
LRADGVSAALYSTDVSLAVSKSSNYYERFVKKVIKSLVEAGVEVHHQRAYEGRISHRTIKVDVSFEYNIVGAKVVVLVECKCYNHSVPVEDVEEFYSKMDDIGAHKGIMVTTVGFQKGAIDVAKGRGIGLALLTPTHQPGEFIFVLNAAGTQNSKEKNEHFWQGNFRRPTDEHAGGFRFESPGQFLSLLFRDEWLEEWEASINPMKDELAKREAVRKKQSE